MRTGAMLQISGVPETLKVGEHLELFSSYYPQPLKLQEVVRMAGLEGLEGRAYGKLSGGQKQRLHFALALCGDPDLLFLDEPTVGLDAASRRTFWEQIRAFTRRGKTVVLTTHYLEEADALADRIIVINEGEVIAQGTPAEIKAQAAGRRIRCVTTLSEQEVKDLPGVTSVWCDGMALDLLVKEAESIVLDLLQRDPEWIPIAQLPSFLQVTAPYLPPYHLSQLALSTLGVQSETWVHIAVLLGFTVLFLLIAAWAYRRDEGQTYG